MRHEMSLRPGPFAAIASGRKRYELRLHDEKRAAIRIGDTICFTCTADDRQLCVRVTGLFPYPDFAALYASLPLLECGYTPENVDHASPQDMEAYYPPEQQARYGVLAIGIERLP
ncbi:MAG: ASCH domain-containing protein [Clostridia bacterium]|nr:ASCH domain-containing protein [Clostridia bacterium]